jgi:uncharacterized protein YcbK (DUF882 family)
MTALSVHFTLDELTHTDHREFDNTPNPQETANLIRLAGLLEDVKIALGNKPVMINSAFRCKQVNDAVGSKDTSQHRIGCAADIRIPGLEPLLPLVCLMTKLFASLIVGLILALLMMQSPHLVGKL